MDLAKTRTRMHFLSNHSTITMISVFKPRPDDRSILE